MKVTRDVIYDLLPVYFAGEVSADTRTLIEEFFDTDPEFARMAQRFRTLYEEHPPDQRRPVTEHAAFERARKTMKRRNESFGGGIGFTLGALFALTPAMFGDEDAAGGLVIAAVFAMVAVMSWVSWYRAGRELRTQ